MCVNIWLRDEKQEVRR